MREEFWVNHQLFKQKRGLKKVEKMISIVHELINCYYDILNYYTPSKRMDSKWRYYMQKIWKTEKLEEKLETELIRIQSRIKLLKRILHG